MVRARLASLALAGTLLVSAGCQTSMDFLHPFRSRNACAVPCNGCDGIGMMPQCCPAPDCGNGFYGDGGGVPLISNAHPPIVEGPGMFPPAPTPIFPGPGMPTMPAMPTMPPVTAPRQIPLPPVVTIPQATATPSPP
jgi:hypothetical protein